MANFNWDGGNQNGMQRSNMYSNNNVSTYPNGVANVNTNNVQRYYIPGRAVNTPDEVKAFEVPMESPISIFPKSDLSEIYVKYWGDDGMIKTMTYQKKMDNSGNNIGSMDIQNDILDRLDRIETAINKQRTYRKPYNKSNTKKEDPS